MRRRDLIVGGGAVLALGVTSVRAAPPTVPMPYDWSSSPPETDRAAYIDWMIKNRGEDVAFLGQRFDRFQQLVSHRDVWSDRDKRAYLMTPRERFVTAGNLDRAYQVHYLDIGYGVTITGPNTVARMTNTLNIQQGERVLEVGTGSGYQSAYLSNLTDQVYSIEIIQPLFERTGGVFASLIGDGYTEYKAVNRRNADGYYGWVEAAPFDKIIVTCGIDHIPPDLLRQLKPDGIMVIPVGPPGSQHVLKVTKTVGADGVANVMRSDIYGGAIVNFVPFTKLDGDRIVGTHSG